jgi:hypothetical protein
MNEVNELTELRELFGDPPAPTARVVAAARARLTEDDAKPVRRRRPWRLQLGLGLGLVAGATAAVVAVASTGGGEPVPRVPAQQAAQQHELARDFLLAGASTLERAKPLPAGAWWRQRAVDGKAFHVDSGGGYSVYMEMEHDSWESRTKYDPPQKWVDQDNVEHTNHELQHKYFTRPHEVRPRSAADVAAWRKDGSPTTWKVRSDDTEITLTKDNRKPPQYEGSPYLHTPNRDLTGADDRPDVVERMNLGKDPARFVAAIRKDAGFVDGSAQELMTGSRYLGDKLAAPASRAAAFRMLAGLKGVRSIGTVKDQMGRTGVGLAPPYIERTDGTVVEYQLVVDPRTYDVLGDQMVVKRAGKDKIPVGSVFSYGYVVSEGWTDAAPPQN